jgi:hypothetical protein
MSRPTRVVLGAALALGPLIACSLVVDTDGLAGVDGTPEAGRLDERANDDRPLVDGPVSDTSIDVPSPDGAPPCVDGPNRFCDDFDQADPGAKWTDRYQSRGFLTFDSPGLSLPHAFNARIAAGGESGSAALFKTFAGTPGSVRCVFDFKIADVPSNGEVDILDIRTTNGGEGHHVYFARFGENWSVAEYQPNADGGQSLDRSTGLNAALPVNTWFNVVFDVTPTVATLTANGTTVRLDGLSPPGGTKRATLGITYANDNIATASFFFDNVDCTTTP